MENLIVQLSKYIIIILFAMYTLYSFTALRVNEKNVKHGVFRKQTTLMMMIHLICNLLLFLNTKNSKVLMLYGAEVVYLILAMVLYQFVYKKLSRLILNNMLMLLVISFVMLTRISFDSAVRQFSIVCAATLVCLIVPIIIDKFMYLDRLGWLYAILGIIFLLLVFVVGQERNGAKNWISIAGFGLQPSEFVKILFVFFAAALLTESTKFMEVVKSTALAAVFVLILVAEKDLGAALIFFVTYLVILYVATANPLYFASGILSGSLAACVAYKLFYHVRVRVAAWRNPWEDINDKGYQISRSLFAIGTGGWFGMGLGQGLPNSIPVVESDFIFSAVSEELGGLFAVCIILVYLSCFIMFIHIATKMKKQFYKLVALGLSVIFIFQVFLSVGGVTKFIPSTGVTLPLISYGGSSVFSTVLLFSIIQGLYVLNQDEDGVSEKGKRKNQYNSQEEQEMTTRKPKKKRNSNREILIMTYVFVGLFILLMAYFTYFMLVESNTVINNPYNARQDLLAERIVRGKIIASGGEVLAETKTDKKGAETRYYPYDNLFCHIVGRFAKGKTGIESSESFTMLTSNGNPVGNLINELSGVKNIGNNVVTTLDVNLQKVASDALGNHKGAIVVLEPSTGKILAMVSKPTYNPNDITDIWDELVEDSEKDSSLINRATQGLYPPGSTFKILTALEYIRENSNYKKYNYTCVGSDTFQGVKINCYDNKKHGEENLKTSFAKSCNASFANIGMMLNLKSFRELCETFLFNSKLPTDLVYNESSFELNENSEQSQIPQTAIGQGNTQISPFHNALITAVIANGGTLMNPYVIDRIETADGNIVKKNMPTTYGTLITTEEANVIKSFMKEVVEDGTSSALNGLSYEVAGKTGSAEFSSADASHAWFVGFAPVKQPKIVVSIIVEGAGTGSEYAVPIAKKIFDAYLK